MLWQMQKGREIMHLVAGNAMQMKLSDYNTDLKQLLSESYKTCQEHVTFQPEIWMQKM